MASVRHELCDPEDPEVTFRVGAARNQVGENEVERMLSWMLELWNLRCWSP